jgi:CRISPR/Cas system-associated protein Cas7 (RAMP superfamily)
MMSNKLIIVSKWIHRYVDDEGNVDNKLTLTSEGIASLTEDLEYIVDKYTGIDDAGFMKCGEIRTDIIELIHSIINKEVSN